MQCMHVNIRKAAFVLLSVLLNNVQHSQMADNHMEYSKKEQNEKNSTSEIEHFSAKPPLVDSILHCPSDLECHTLDTSCIDCEYNTACTYGSVINTTCRTNQLVKCKGEKIFQKSLICRYCYQTEAWEHTCELKANCNSAATPRAYYKTNCTVRNDVLCLGHRTFYKNVRCNWTGGYRWSTALALSITLGGFGADRFYLGHWQEAIGKLFSFGGLGVWTLIDVILISLHYLGPADGSLYI